MKRYRTKVGLFVLVYLGIAILTLEASKCPAKQIEYKDQHGHSHKCVDVCPPKKTTDRDVIFCQTNCEIYYACLRELFPSCPPVAINSSTTSSSCQKAPDFYHPLKGFCSCALACQSLDEFCEDNCPGHFTCLSENQQVFTTTTRENTQTTWQVSNGHHTDDRHDEADNNNIQKDFASVAFAISAVLNVVLFAMLVIFVVVVFVHVRRRQAKKDLPDGVTQTTNVEQGPENELLLQEQLHIKPSTDGNQTLVAETSLQNCSLHSDSVVSNDNSAASVRNRHMPPSLNFHEALDLCSRNGLETPVPQSPWSFATPSPVIPDLGPPEYSLKS